MRLVRRQELMTLPAGTLFAELNEPWIFGQLCLKGETIADDDGDRDFWFRSLCWPQAFNSMEAVTRLEEMAADSSVSYPVENAEQRDGMYDDAQVYAVYEASDARVLVECLDLMDLDIHRQYEARRGQQ